VKIPGEKLTFQKRSKEKRSTARVSQKDWGVERTKILGKQAEDLVGRGGGV